MARIRSIHPGLLTDEAYMALTVENPLAIALYLGLLMESDDYGVFEWKPMTIKARILPAVTTGVEELLDALVKHRFIGTFDVDGRRLGAIRNFCRYQRPKKPNSVHPRTPAVDQWVGTSSPAVPNRSGTSTENPPQMEDGGGRMEDGGGAASAAAARAGDLSKLEFDCRALVGEEPVVLAQDFHVLTVLLEDGLVEDDIRTGIREAIERRSDPKQRFRKWASFAGWCRTAAQNRLAAAPRRRSGPAPPVDEGPRFHFNGTYSAPYAVIRKLWQERKWVPEWGPTPDEPGCRIKPEVMAEIMGERVDA